MFVDPSGCSSGILAVGLAVNFIKLIMWTNRYLLVLILLVYLLLYIS